MPRGNPDKLIPQNRRTKQEQSEIARKGGIKSGKVRREKKLMSEIYAEFLDKNHDIIGKDGIKKTISGTALVNSVMSKVFSRGDSASVSLMKEIRETLEGSKILFKDETDRTELLDKINGIVENFKRDING